MLDAIRLARWFWYAVAVAVLVIALIHTCTRRKQGEQRADRYRRRAEQRAALQRFDGDVR